MISNFKASQVTLDRLNELEVVTKLLENNNIFYSVIGGFAVDGYAGRLTRDHDDIDMVSYRNDINKIQIILANKGYTFKDFARNGETIPYKIFNQEPTTITFHIIDKLNNNFEVVFWYPGHLQYPTTLLTRKSVIINNVSFYVINKELLIGLKNKQINIEAQHLDNPNHEKKYKDSLHDLEILRNT